MDDSELIRSQIKGLEAQLRVLEARIHSSSRLPVQEHSFADLYGRLSGLADSTEEEIEQSLYQLPSSDHDT
jgi:hypothetical protein